MKNRRDIFIIVGLFVALILFIALGPGRQQAPSDPPTATTHSSAPEGALALDSWAREIGYDGRRLEYRAFELDERDAALVLLNPSQPVSRTQSRAILDWVQRGGALIPADPGNPFFRAADAVPLAEPWMRPAIMASATCWALANLAPSTCRPASLKMPRSRPTYNGRPEAMGQ